jgi:glycosyltransferase A (GT-A) superfamily protein (DUF2064 family)
MKPETIGEVGTPLMVGDRPRLCPPLEPAEAATLARCFLQDRLEQLAAFTPQERAEELQSLLPTGVRLIPQAGEDLGARLDRLLTDLLGEGYAGAIAVDADSPTLPSVYLEEACRQLLAGGSTWWWARRKTAGIT